MIGPSGSKGRTGAAAGLLGPPPRTMATFCSNIGRLTATGRVADAPIPASPGRAGELSMESVYRIDGAMRWQPTMVEARRRTSAQGIRGRCPGPRRRSGVSGLRGLATTTDLLVRA